ncbi:von Willebrand factor A-like protein [Gracilaria domingensis]|nr:von Willebrand factor A-like protein [Gracilaria domingensis]
MYSTSSTLLLISFLAGFLHCLWAQPPQDLIDPMFESVLQERTDALVKVNTVAKQIGAPSVLDLQRKIVLRGSCSRPVCFAVDGSGSIPAEDFLFQLDLVSLLAVFASLDNEAEFSAVQYGLRPSTISSQTSNITLFLDSVRATKQARAPRTFIGTAISSCLRFVRRGKPDTVDSSIIVLGDGRANIAVDFLDETLAPIDEEEVFSVGIGREVNRELLLQLAGGVRENLVLFDSYSRINRAGVSSLLSNICTFSSSPKRAKGRP